MGKYLNGYTPRAVDDVGLRAAGLVGSGRWPARRTADFDYKLLVKPPGAPPQVVALRQRGRATT